ncbi:low molecular weight protein-tyrosine-phosphatase [Treponema sp.]|uniref:low molecular weight protein-tyrosine-phosphatase n=1 Tax=Treponema sp. TaxID=166 RepID=UPI00298E8DF8|nr:low molecular weight protein-tyrosine-phosphatase [Treponema sp.]MCR5612483.1 low molecular weight phosphotyrosine protein phosphatase [Treponema sp.]
MKRILFVCHGNICRSPMAEFVFKDMVKKAGRENEFYIDSAATSTEEIGNPMHYGTRTKLREEGIPFTDHRARQITIDDYNDWDLLICMDRNNLRNMQRILGEDTDDKMHFLLEYAGLSRDIADPWYTGNFDETYDDVVLGCKNLLRSV